MNKALAALLSLITAAAPAAAQNVSIQVQPAQATGGVSSAAPLPEASMEGPAALSDYFDIKNTADFPVGMQDLRSMQPDLPSANTRGLEAGSRAPAESLAVQDRPFSSAREGSAARTAPAAAGNAPVVASPALSEVPAPGESVKARLMVLPEPGATRDAAGPAAYPAANSADMERKAVLMSTLFDGAQLEAAMRDRVPSDALGRLLPPRTASSRPARLASLTASQAAPALSATPERRSGGAASKGESPDLTSDQAARALGGAAGSMLVTGAGTLAWAVRYAPQVVLEWEKDILLSDRSGPIQKAVYAGLLPAAVALSVGLSPFAGGLLGLLQGYEDGKEAGFRRAIAGARDNVRGVKARLKGLVEILQEEGEKAGEASNVVSIVGRARSLRRPQEPGGLLATPDGGAPRNFKEILPALSMLVGIISYLSVKVFLPYAGFAADIAALFLPILVGFILKAVLK